MYVDDEQPNLDLFRRCFDEEFNIEMVSSGPAALELLQSRQDIGLVLSDHRMAPMTGVELLERVQRERPMITRMLLTAFSDQDLLLQAIQRGGVQDFVLKPFERQDLSVRLRIGLQRYRAQNEVVIARDSLQSALDESVPFGEIVGFSQGLSEVRRIVERVAAQPTTVLVLGENGTGKELIAREIHRRSPRASRPFIRVNCASLAEGLMASELFGHEKNAFPGAHQRIGRFEQADGGTIFLDEIGDLPASVQVSLLRVIQERQFERAGGNNTITVDVRIITATHRDLARRVQEGVFREDLFHRLSVVPVRLPPLRQRPDDIEALAVHFLEHFNRQCGRRLKLGASAITALRCYDWPGNVRELRNVIERVVVLADQAETLVAEDFVFDTVAPPPEPAQAQAQSLEKSAKEVVVEQRRAEYRAALLKAEGNKRLAARMLGLPYTTFKTRLETLGVQ